MMSHHFAPPPMDKAMVQSKCYVPVGEYLREKERMGIIHIIGIHDNVQPDGKDIPEHLTAEISGHYGALHTAVIPEVQEIVKQVALSSYRLTHNFFYMTGASVMRRSENIWNMTRRHPIFTVNLTAATLMGETDAIIAQLWAGDRPELCNKFSYKRAVRQL